MRKWGLEKCYNKAMIESDVVLGKPGDRSKPVSSFER